jgi:hypothetical protein
MSKIKIYLMFLFFMLLSCEEWFIKDKEFSMEAIPYTGNELRIDGYYYKKTDSDTTRAHVLVFYANGIQFGGSSVESLIGIEDRFRDPNYIKDLRDCLFCWGPYDIKDGVLRFEFYSIFGNYWHIVRANCNLLNDTIFVIKQTNRIDGKNVSRGDFLGEYRFKQFIPKPDSTNYIIK